MYSILPQEKNPVLREKARTLTQEEMTSAHTQTLIKEMKHLLAQEAHGVAIAAPQVGEGIRLFIVSGQAIAESLAEPEAKNIPPLPDQIYMNPQITRISRTKSNKHEGCLSVRGKWGIVPRAEKATIVAYDEHGKKFTRGASGFLAHIFQHEMDHLEGTLYIDKAVELYDDEGK